MKTGVLESGTGNPLSPEPFVSSAKDLPTKGSEKGYGDENVCDSDSQVFTGSETMES